MHHFETITDAHWERGLRLARATPNAIREKLNAKLLVHGSVTDDGQMMRIEFRDAPAPLLLNFGQAYALRQVVEGLLPEMQGPKST